MNFGLSYGTGGILVVVFVCLRCGEGRSQLVSVVPGSVQLHVFEHACSE